MDCGGRGPHSRRALWKGEGEASRGAWRGQKGQHPFEDPGPAHGALSLTSSCLSSFAGDTHVEVAGKGGGPVPLPSSQPRDTGSRAVWPTVRAHVLRTTNRDSAFGPETPTRGPQGLSLGARGLSTWGRSFCPAKDTEILCLTPWGGGSGDRGRGTGTGGTQLCSLQRELRACRSPTARHGACTPFLSPSTRGRANAASTLTRRASQSDGDPLGPGWEVPLHPAQGSRALGPPSD